MAEELISEDLTFPSVPESEIPEDSDALRAILAGQRGMEELYRALARECAGDTRFLATLFEADWRKRAGEMVRHGEELLRMLGCEGPQLEEVLPQPAAVESMVMNHKEADPTKAACLVEEFAARALCCHRFVPWTSENERVFEHFRECLEVEDGHLGVIDLLRSLVAVTS